MATTPYNVNDKETNNIYSYTQTDNNVIAKNVVIYGADGQILSVIDGSLSATVTGSVTANAGTNLNTSALALESGGNLATIAGAISSSKMATKSSDGDFVTLGAKTDAKSTATDATAVSLISLLKQISYMEQNPASRAVTGTITANAGTNLNTSALATSANQTAQSTLFGAVTETAPASDTASSGLNGRLQRIAQRITSLIALIPTALGQGTMATSFKVVLPSDQSAIPASQSGTWNVTNVSGTVSLPTGAATSANQTAQSTLFGAVTETAPASDTASSGLNGRLQRIAQRITSLIALLPTALGQGTMAQSFKVAIASDQSAISTIEAASTSLGTAQLNVTTAGTRVQLGTNTCKSVTVKAKVTNTGYIYVGTVATSSTVGFILSGGETLSLDISNTNLLYIDSSVSGEGISYVYVN